MGCNNCYHTGYQGRRAIYEVLEMDAKTIDSIKNNTLKDFYNQDESYKTLSDKAFDILAEGETSLDEIYSILINSN